MDNELTLDKLDAELAVEIVLTDDNEVEDDEEDVDDDEFEDEVDDEVEDEVDSVLAELSDDGVLDESED